MTEVSVEQQYVCMGAVCDYECVCVCVCDYECVCVCVCVSVRDKGNIFTRAWCSLCAKRNFRFNKERLSDFRTHTHTHSNTHTQAQTQFVYTHFFLLFPVQGPRLWSNKQPSAAPMLHGNGQDRGRETKKREEKKKKTM